MNSDNSDSESSSSEIAENNQEEVTRELQLSVKIKQDAQRNRINNLQAALEEKDKRVAQLQSQNERLRKQKKNQSQNNEFEVENKEKNMKKKQHGQYFSNELGTMSIESEVMEQPQEQKMKEQDEDVEVTISDMSQILEQYISKLQNKSDKLKAKNILCTVLNDLMKS